MSHPRTKVLLGLLALLLSACTPSDDTTPPVVSLNSPAANSPVNGTVAVQVSASDNKGVLKVSVYARTPGSTAQGLLVGTATSKPYVISWYTPSVPNLADVELYASAVDGAGNIGRSDPVLVKTNNPGLPLMTYLAGFNLPKSGTSTLSVQTLNLPHVDITGVRLPAGVHMTAQTLRGQGLTIGPNRQVALEWAWPTFVGADGYGIYLSNDRIGPYTRKVNQAAASAGTQKYSANLSLDDLQKPQYGVITAITQNRTVESGFSNAQQAAFISDQQSASPANGQAVPGGRPTLTWLKNADTSYYLYFVYDAPPLDATANLKWSSGGTTTTELSAPYPSSLAALPSGTYYWWVAAVGFDQNDQANAFSYSDVKTFVVP